MATGLKSRVLMSRSEYLHQIRIWVLPGLESGIYYANCTCFLSSLSFIPRIFTEPFPE